jgi:2-hydroxychromene-2-carboxylate isomerase
MIQLRPAVHLQRPLPDRHTGRPLEPRPRSTSGSTSPAPTRRWQPSASATSARGLEVRWHPFLLGPIFQAQGWNDSPFNLFPAKGRWMWRDVPRRAARSGAAFRQPSRFPPALGARQPGGPGRARRGLGEDCVRAIFRAEFEADADIADPAVMAGIVSALGRDGAAVRLPGDEPAHQGRAPGEHRPGRDARASSAPHFLVDGELFWGDDRWTTPSPGRGESGTLPRQVRRRPMRGPGARPEGPPCAAGAVAIWFLTIAGGLLAPPEPARHGREAPVRGGVADLPRPGGGRFWASARAGRALPGLRRAGHRGGASSGRRTASTSRPTRSLR